jgi:hypothetical protein
VTTVKQRLEQIKSRQPFDKIPRDDEYFLVTQLESHMEKLRVARVVFTQIYDLDSSEDHLGNAQWLADDALKQIGDEV